jgi:hypothetical protein
LIGSFLEFLIIGGILMLRGVGYGWAGFSYLDYFSEMCEKLEYRKKGAE